MLKIRVIPTLLWKRHTLVKGVSFDSWRSVGTVMPAIKVYNARDVDELVLLDIAAGKEGRSLDYRAVEELAAECFVPLTVGGGVCNLDMIRQLLACGADKVVVNSAAYENPRLIAEAADHFGAQCVVVSIDALRGADGQYECFRRCGSEPTGKEPSQWASEMEKLGAGEILITSIEQDGQMQGYDLDLIARITASVGIPVIAAGGAGSYQHLYEALNQANASAVAAASMFHFTQQTPAGAKQFLANRGIAVRDYHAMSAKAA